MGGYIFEVDLRLCTVGRDGDPGVPPKCCLSKPALTGLLVRLLLYGKEQVCTFPRLAGLSEGSPRANCWSSLENGVLMKP